MRAPERTKAGTFVINGVPLAPIAKTIENGDSWFSAFSGLFWAVSAQRQTLTTGDDKVQEIGPVWQGAALYFFLDHTLKL